MSSGAVPLHPADIAPQFAALNLNGPSGPSGPRPSYPTIVDVGAYQPRGQVTSKKPATHLAFRLTRLNQPGVKPTWRYAEPKRLLFSSEELAERAAKRKLAASKVYGTLPPNMRSQVDALVEGENRLNQDRAFEWVLVAIDTKAAHLGRLEVIIRRDPNPRAVPNTKAGGYPGTAPDLKSQAFQGRPPAPIQQHQQQQKQGAPPQKQPPADGFG